ncbi:hypothetical protein [Adlercreutzia sp. ZJ242]|uniref:hypothetical protein n=1 Tax=Adlercreutzia sp. ZJ242 TaxID=2709409 RepID=UPI0013ECD421|nr:hypothetical protein [Adlercreutzia sp. ZJ242]
MSAETLSCVFSGLAALIWAGLGAVVVLAVWALRERKRQKHEPTCAAYAELLGKPCWMKRSRKAKRYVKYRIVAVSHKGSINIREWDDDSGKGAFWVNKDCVSGRVKFSEPNALLSTAEALAEVLSE